MLKSSLREPEKGKKRPAPGLYRGAGLNRVKKPSWYSPRGLDVDLQWGRGPCCEWTRHKLCEKRHVQIMTENSAKRTVQRRALKGQSLCLQLKNIGRKKLERPKAPV
jgi:hypothetical protein